MAVKKVVSCLLLVQEEPDLGQPVLAAGAEQLVNHRGALCSCLGMTQSSYFNPRSELLPSFILKNTYIKEGKHASHGKLPGTF